MALWCCVTEQVIYIRIRHRDAVPPEWRILNIPIIEDINVPVTVYRLVYSNGETEDRAL
jgi:hypothetical protein